MKLLEQTSGLTERVYNAILHEILDGDLKPGEHLVQEQLAEQLGVSRQPVQQAMALLKADGLIEQFGRRGLRVCGLDLDRMQNHYDIRGLLDGHAARMAAERVQAGKIDRAKGIEEMHRLFRCGNRAAQSGTTREQIEQDEAFHYKIYEYSGNPVILETVELHWRYLRRPMGEVLRHAEPPEEIWNQHAEIAEAILSGKPAEAGELATTHAKSVAHKLQHALEEMRGRPAQAL